MSRAIASCWSTLKVEAEQRIRTEAPWAGFVLWAFAVDFLVSAASSHRGPSLRAFDELASPQSAVWQSKERHSVPECVPSPCSCYRILGGVKQVLR